METVRIRDPGSGMEKSRIRDKHPGSATLPTTAGTATKGTPGAEEMQAAVRTSTTAGTPGLTGTLATAECPFLPY